MKYKNVKYTPLQELYLCMHHFVYAKRLKKQIRFPDKYIISIGNMSSGGTGKTPLTALLADKFKKKKPMAVLRGYKRKSSRAGLVSDGKNILMDYLDAGDEAIMLSHVPGLKVAVSRDRADAVNKFADDSGLILLDDAFQNPSVFRDHELVLVDATIPPEDVRVFPSGYFRDDLTSLKRADTILLTRTDMVRADNLIKWHDIIEKYAPGVPVFDSIHEVQGIFPTLRERKVGAFCGIGNPESFFSIVRSRGYEIVKKFAWPDHHAFTERDADMLNSWELPLITTEKDAVRLEEFRSGVKNIRLKYHVLKIKLKIKNEKVFLKRVISGRG